MMMIFYGIMGLHVLQQEITKKQKKLSLNYKMKNIEVMNAILNGSQKLIL
jgi:hypothetical protein